MIRGEAMFFLGGGSKDSSIQTGENNCLFSKTVIKKSLFRKLPENGLISKEKTVCYICLRGNKSLFLVRSKQKSLHRGKTIATQRFFWFAP